MGTYWSSASKLLAHLVLVVKYQRKELARDILQSDESICGHVAADMDALIIEFGEEGDHIHLLMQLPLTIMIYHVVKLLNDQIFFDIHKNYCSCHPLTAM